MSTSAAFSVKNNKGFSLVELMVVVAIIGILAAIGIPSMQKYMAKARQTEAKSNLSSIYTAEKSFFAEYSAYDNRFGAIGFSPEGKLRYNVGFDGGLTAGAGAGYNTVPTVANIQANGFCTAGGGAVNAGATCSILNGATNIQPPNIAAAMCTATGVDAGDCSTKATSFQAGAVAVLLNTGTQDYWAIDNVKELRNTQDGL